METVTDFIFLGSKITVDSYYSHEIKRHLLLGRKTMTTLDSVLKNRDITLPTEVHIAKAMVFPVVMYRCEIWNTRKAEHWLILLNSGAGEGFWESLDLQEVKPVNPKGNQPWIFIRRMDAEALIFWRPDAKSWLTGKDPDAGKCWRQEENGMTQDEMVGWHHQQEGHEFEQAPGDDEGQGSLAGCSPWGHKESIWLSNKSKRNHFEKAMYYSDSNCENNTVETTKRSVIVRDVWGGREGYTEAYRILEQLKLFSMIS